MRSLSLRFCVVVLAVFGLISTVDGQDDDIPPAEAATIENARKPRDASSQRYWMENMVCNIDLRQKKSGSQLG